LQTAATAAAAAGGSRYYHAAHRCTHCQVQGVEHGRLLLLLLLLLLLCIDEAVQVQCDGWLLLRLEGAGAQRLHELAAVVEPWDLFGLCGDENMAEGQRQ
jgi:hypothetical protein